MSEKNTQENAAVENAVKEIIAAFRQSVKTQIDGDKRHGWGVEDSLAVVIDVSAQWAENIPAIRQEDKVDKAFRSAIKEVINPSQFRQKIEGTEEEVEKGKALLLKGEGRKEKMKGMIEELIG